MAGKTTTTQMHDSTQLSKRVWYMAAEANNAGRDQVDRGEEVGTQAVDRWSQTIQAGIRQRRCQWKHRL